MAFPTGVEPVTYGFEGFVGCRGGGGLEGVELAHTMAAQTAIQPRARGLAAEELAHHREQVIQRQQQGLARLVWSAFG